MRQYPKVLIRSNEYETHLHWSKEDMVKKQDVWEDSEADNDGAELDEDLAQPDGGPGTKAGAGFEESHVANDPQIGRQLSRCHP